VTSGLGVRALRRLLLGSLLGVLLVLLAGGPASAHAELESTDPAAGAVLPRPPEQVRLRFTESVTTPTGAVRVLAPDGTSLDLGPVRARGALVTVDLPTTLARGSYLVVWRVVSDDSHPVAGSFSFSVGERSAVPSASPPSAPRGLSMTLGVLRWLGFVGAALAIGGLAFAAWCRPGASLVRLQVAGALLVAGAATASLLVKGPYDAGLGWGSLGRPGLVQDVLATTYGRATLTRVVLGLLLAALALASRRLSTGDLALAGSVLAVCLAGSFALAGHAAAGALRPLALASESVHVLAMSIWLGGLVAVVATARSADARDAVDRFSRVALGCLTALVATGLFQAWRQVGSFSALTTTRYGHLLVIKGGLVLMTLAVAAGTVQLVRRRGPLPSIRQSVALEVVLASAVLAVTAGLVATEPARSVLER
jgi:copper transport protein